MKNYEVESLNYSETSRLLEAFTKYLGTQEGKTGSYNIKLLRKLERNKRVLYDIHFENESTLEG